AAISAVNVALPAARVGGATLSRPRAPNRADYVEPSRRAADRSTFASIDEVNVESSCSRGEHSTFPAAARALIALPSRG
ncbi:MAG TPA: hypothetical protein VH276_03780, partial [Solirubrobacteraceae bacterium]|nr:hypothetical protein [Solirubrobacteraceae bacterium]